MTTPSDAINVDNPHLINWVKIATAVITALFISTIIGGFSAFANISQQMTIMGIQLVNVDENVASMEDRVLEREIRLRDLEVRLAIIESQGRGNNR
jgi:hypothetical protein